jgi:hypothetical protein
MDDRTFWTTNRKIWLAAHIVAAIVVVTVILVLRSH